jgi:2-polyprenyl-6-methoxyphenol hydroxylase-like FAD-dependent oxidoreductase
MSAVSADLMVLGAGPAGLTFAWQAAQRGHSVVVLERDARAGGLAASFEVAGVRVDHGCRWLDAAVSPRVLGDLRSLLGDDLQQRARRGRLRVADRWVGFPLRAGELARTLPRPFLTAIARDAMTAPLRRVREDSYASVLRRGLGPTLYDSLYGPYAYKLWGLPGERIAGEQARRRVSADTAWKVAARAVRGGVVRTTAGPPAHLHLSASRLRADRRRPRRRGRRRRRRRRARRRGRAAARALRPGDGDARGRRGRQRRRVASRRCRFPRWLG